MSACLNEKEEKKKKNKAIYWYTKAIIYALAGDIHIAEGYARESIAILAEVNTDTLEACLTDTIVKNGVLIPEIFHEDVVRAHMKRYGINLANFKP